MAELERLDTQYPWSDSPIQSQLRALMSTLEVRFQMLEAFTPSWENEVDSLTSVALSRVDDVLGPLLERLTAAAQLGFLVVYANDQDANLVVEEVVGLTVTSGGKELFTPTPWLTIMDSDDETNWGMASLESYDSSTGELSIRVTYASTGTTGSNWTIACSSGVLPATVDASETAVAAKEDVETLAGQFASNLATLQDLLESLQGSSAVISVTYNGKAPAQSGAVDLSIAIGDIPNLQTTLDAKATVTYVNTQVATKQSSSAKLTAIDALSWAADKILGLTGTAALGVYDISAFTRDTLISKADAAAWRAALGVADITFASDAQIRASTGAYAVSAAALASASALVTLTDAATIAIDWSAGINFQVTLTANRVLGNPTNGVPGQTRTVLLKGDSTTDRALTYGNQYQGGLPTMADIDSGRWYLLTIFCITASHFAVAAQKVYG